ncbi:MAG: cyclodeaminase/cyclohydrolase family protein, partial [Candidatus Omnitrophota bacterium]|nr:cyclodeaminase/cyclohydrolase family protein [Candidatus Omnitrophota bacterium]
MEKVYIDGPLHEYLDDLAGKTPAPGGGSGAALSASIGAALMSMVANYTVGNPKYKAGEERAADILIKAENYRADLQRLIDKDVEAYEKLSKGIRGAGKDSPVPDQLY